MVADTGSQSVVEEANDVQAERVEVSTEASSSKASYICVCEGNISASTSTKGEVLVAHECGFSVLRVLGSSISGSDNDEDECSSDSDYEYDYCEESDGEW